MLILRALFSGCSLSACRVFAASNTANARDIINAPFDAVSIDILKVTEQIQSTRRAKPTWRPRPAASTARRAGVMRLSSRGRAGRSTAGWCSRSAIPVPIPLDYVIVSQRRSPSSAPASSGRVSGCARSSTSRPRPACRRRSEALADTADAYTFRVEANQTVTYALEVIGPVARQPQPLAAQRLRSAQPAGGSFYHGLLARHRRARGDLHLQPVHHPPEGDVPGRGALFAWGGTAFLAIEFGYLPVLARRAGGRGVQAPGDRRGGSWCSPCSSRSTRFVELRKRIPVLGYAHPGR